MGRALFSTIYTPTVAVRTEPEIHVQTDLPRCENWSISNPFDPDSDEFYEHATREVFTDTEAWHQEQEAVRELLVAQAQGSAESSASSEASESDAGSPMAVGSDDPALLLVASAYPHSEWGSRWNPTVIPHDWVSHSSPAEEEVRVQARATRRRSSTISAGFIPPSFPREPAATEFGASTSQSPTSWRSVSITPINIPNEPSPRPPSPISPSTPTDAYHRDMATMFTPSPAPSVTPHVYTWRPARLTVPASPLANMSGGSGPLTNPSARMSLAHLNIASTRVHIQNAAV